MSTAGKYNNIKLYNRETQYSEAWVQRLLRGTTFCHQTTFIFCTDKFYVVNYLRPTTFCLTWLTTFIIWQKGIFHLCKTTFFWFWLLLSNGGYNCPQSYLWRETRWVGTVCCCHWHSDSLPYQKLEWHVGSALGWCLDCQWTILQVFLLLNESNRLISRCAGHVFWFV